jgi:hypothetical protein
LSFVAQRAKKEDPHDKGQLALSLLVVSVVELSKGQANINGELLVVSILVLSGQW